MREATPAVVEIDAHKGRPADPFLSGPFVRFFFEGLGRLASGEVGPTELLVRRFESRSALAGATVAKLSPGRNRHLGLDLFEAGVIVLKLERAMPAPPRRLRRGGLIRTVAGARVEETAELTSALHDHSMPWRLEIERAGRRPWW